MSRTSIYYGPEMKAEILTKILLDEKRFSELEKHELSSMRRVSVQHRSHMKNLIDWFKENDLPYDVVAIRARLIDDEKTSLVGWGYIELNYREEVFETGLYVQREYRGLGIGTRIINEIKQFKDDDKEVGLIAKPWDYRGKCFFNKNGIYYDAKSK